METISFNHYDAWILLTIPFEGEGTDMEGIIANADAINHAIPNDEEIEGALDRAIKAGLIEINNGKFRFKKENKGEIEAVVNKSKSIFKSWENLEKYLNKKSWPIVTQDNFKLKPGETKKAYEKYNKKF
jgi:hypothetical protein